MIRAPTTVALVTPTIAWRRRPHDSCDLITGTCACVPPLSVLAVEALCLRGTVTKPLPGQLADFSSNKVVLAVIETYRGCNSLRQDYDGMQMCRFQ